MPEQKRHKNQDNGKPANLPLAFFACPNGDCADFNRFDADNLSVAEWMDGQRQSHPTAVL